MLSDEEKKAIEYLKQNNIVEIQYDNYGLESIHRVGIDEKQTILNLIEKQSKEIEELKEKNNNLMEELDLTTVYISGVYDGEKKVENKIKAKIEEKFLEAKGLYERGVQPQAQYTMKLLKDLEESLLEKE